MNYKQPQIMRTRTRKDVQDELVRLQVEKEAWKKSDDYDGYDGDFEHEYLIDGLNDLLRLEDFDEPYLLEIYKHAKKYEDLFGCEAAGRLEAIEWVLMRSVKDEELVGVQELTDNVKEQVERLIEFIKAGNSQKKTIVN